MALTLDDLEMIKARILETTVLQGVRPLESAHTSVWVGSGLAKISAAYGAALCERYSGHQSRMMTALDYCHKPFLQALPVLLSLKGHHEDAVSVAEVIVKRSIDNSILITGEPEGQAAMALKSSSLSFSIVTASLPERDRRFVNCSSIFMLSALAYQVVKQALGKEFFESISEEQLTLSFYKVAEASHAIIEGITIEDWQNKQLIVLGQGLGSELALPWQSIFAEAGITTPIFLDIKDYTHGDHLASVRLNNAMFLVIQQPGLEEICRIFVSRFSSRYIVKLISLETIGPMRYWENLFYCCNAADALTKMLGYGGQRPPKDPVVHGWRGWGCIMP
jgi:hypothetical protein